MLETLRALRDFLETQRTVTASALGDQPMGVASCAVLDDLLARIRSVTYCIPADATMTLSVLDEVGAQAATTLTEVADVLDELVTLTEEGIAAAEQRRQPFIELLRAVEAQGFTIDLATLTDVSDSWDWSKVDDLDDPALRIQLEAERIARAEQAAIYARRLRELNADIESVEADYAARIRRLTTAR
ncbi:MAG: hypothetical protein DIU75_011645 [Mycolicibacterium hassiacum]